MTQIPKVEENPTGLHQRYVISKAPNLPDLVEDDGKMDPDAVYLVMRLDHGGDDEIWTECCRRAAAFLGGNLMRMGDKPHHPKLGEEIRQLVRDLEQ